jgi:hypothetical protein
MKMVLLMLVVWDVTSDVFIHYYKQWVNHILADGRRHTNLRVNIASNNIKNKSVRRNKFIQWSIAVACLKHHVPFS